MKEHVVLVPETACERLDAMAGSRREQISEVKEQVDVLQEEARQID